MTVQAFKNYLKSLKFAGSVIDNTQQAIVDAAADAAFGKVWEAHVWKIGRKLKTDTTMTASQGHTILPGDLSGIRTVRVISGTRSRRIHIMGEDNFDENFTNPSAYPSAMPAYAKLVYHSPANDDKWRLYWDRLPDSGYTLHISYRPVATIAFLPNCPDYMLEPMMLVGSELILPSGPTQGQQFSLGKAALHRAIQSDESFVGTPDSLGGDPGWDDWSAVSSGGSVWDPR